MAQGHCRSALNHKSCGLCSDPSALYRIPYTRYRPINFQFYNFEYTPQSIAVVFWAMEMIISATVILILPSSPAACLNSFSSAAMAT